MASISGKSFAEWMVSIKNVHYSSKERMDRAMLVLDDTHDNERPFWIRSK